MNDQDYLAHYGVVGMKWGVRKNPSKAYTKAVKKKNKLQSKALDKTNKSIKKEKQASKTLRKAKTEKELKKAQRKIWKAEDLSIQSKHLQKKAMKWQKQMDKVFADYDVNRVKKETVLKGEKFVYELTKKERE